MQSELRACRCGRTPRLTKRDVEPQSDTWYQGRMALFVICDCGICLFDKYFHEGFSSEPEAIAAWNARAESDAEITQRVQEAINSVDFKDVKSRILREYLKAGARRVIAAINAALQTSTGEGN